MDGEFRPRKRRGKKRMRKSKSRRSKAYIGSPLHKYNLARKKQKRRRNKISASEARALGFEFYRGKDLYASRRGKSAATKKHGMGRSKKRRRGAKRSRGTKKRWNGIPWWAGTSYEPLD